MEDQFTSRFVKANTVPTSIVYEYYEHAARKLWSIWSDKYDLRPKSPKKVADGTNRSIKFYKNDCCVIEISVGKTTTIYVYDETFLTCISLKYNQDNQGHYRYTFQTIDECIEAIKDYI